MNDNIYKNLAESQLISTFEQGAVSNQSINKEWYRREKVNFPYIVNAAGTIMNMITKEHVEDSECDRMIVRQAEHIRSGRVSVFENNEVVD